MGLTYSPVGLIFISHVPPESEAPEWSAFITVEVWPSRRIQKILTI